MSKALSLAHLPAPTGASLVGFQLPAAGAASQTLFTKVSQTVSVFDFMSATKTASVLAADLQQDVTAEINACLAYLGTLPTGGTAEFPDGLYKTTGTINIPDRVNVYAKSMGWILSSGGYHSGAMLYKAHTGNAVSFNSGNNTGTYDGLSVISDYGLYPSGNGICSMNAFGTIIRNCGVFSVAGDAFIFGNGNGSQSYTIQANNVYANNPQGRCFVVDSLWFRGDTLIADGGFVAALDITSNAGYFSIGRLHLEGYHTTAVRNACANGTFYGTNIIIPYNNQLTAIQGVSISGSQACTYDGFKVTNPPAFSSNISSAVAAGILLTVTCVSNNNLFVGSIVSISGTSGLAGLNATFTITSIIGYTQFTAVWGGSNGTGTGGVVTCTPVSSIGVSLGTLCWNNRVINCDFNNTWTGVYNRGNNNTLNNNSHFQNNLPVDEGGANTAITNNRTSTTLGSYSIQQTVASSGIWTGNQVDKPMYSLVTAAQGDFGTVRVKDNPGYKTSNWGNANLTAGNTVSHGLTMSPAFITFNIYVGGITSPVITVATTSTTFTPTWTGTSPAGMLWNAVAKCELV